MAANCGLNNVWRLFHLDEKEYTWCQSFQNMVANCGLNDVWRLFHLEEKEYTWCQRNPFTARRLDY
jgi:exonuclease III